VPVPVAASCQMTAPPSLHSIVPLNIPSLTGLKNTLTLTCDTALIRPVSAPNTWSPVIVSSSAGTVTSASDMFESVTLALPSAPLLTFPNAVDLGEMN